MLNYTEDVKRGKVIVQDAIPYRLEKRVKGSFVSYIPDCEDEVDGYDDQGNYYDENCKVCAEEKWWAVNMYTEQIEIIKINSFYANWYTLLDNEKKYKKISIDEDTHKNWQE